MEKQIIFRLKGYTPETLPLGRLAEYLAAFAEMVGDEPVHLRRVNKGSAAIAMAVKNDRFEQVASNVRLAPVSDLDTPQRKAYERIEGLLRKDQTTAVIKPDKGAVILSFHGAIKPTIRLASVKEPGEICGRVIRLGGKDATIPISVQTPDGVVTCNTSLDIAKRLKEFLLEPIDVIFNGIGKWERTDDGGWVLAAFDIRDFSRAKFDDFDEALSKVRAEGSGWDVITDISGELQKLRYGEK